MHRTLIVAVILLAGCTTNTQNVASNSAGSASTTNTEELTTESGEPAYITVQHCLIGFKGSVPGANRSEEEAKALAEDLFQKAQEGADFDEMVTKFTDDAAPGIYKMANYGFADNMGEGIFARSGMVAAFGDTGFPLEVGEYGMAPFDPMASPYGWHIVKRIE